MRRVVGSSKVFNRQKASSTVWYTNNEGDEEGSEATSSQGFTLPHAATAHTALDHMDKDQTNGTVSRYSPHHILGNRARWLLGMPNNPTVVKGPMDEAKLESLKEDCKRKISKLQRVMEAEMRSMQERTAEFLFISKKADSSQTARVKSVYEKKAKKSAAYVRTLQRKLELYQKKLERLEKMIDEHSTRFRNRGGSLDNINIILELPKEPLAKKVCITLPRNSRYRSAEFLPPKDQPNSSNKHDVQNKQDQTFHYSTNSDEEQGVEMTHQEFNSLVSDIEESYKKHKDLERMIENIRTQMENKRDEWRLLIEESRYRGDHLEEQINDMMELHQQQVLSMKQELSSLEEKLEYQMEERTRDLQDLVDTCQTKISKLEFQQQQTISVETLETFSIKDCATKIANAILTAFTFSLIIISFVIGFVKNCLQNKVLCLATCLMLLTSVFIWRSSRSHDLVRTSASVGTVNIS